MGNLMNNSGGQQGMEGLLGVGQRLAEQMQQANPDLVNQLRNQMNRDGTNPDGSGGAGGASGGGSGNPGAGEPPK